MPPGQQRVRRLLCARLASWRLPGLLAAGALIAVDQIFGSAAYGTVAIIPAVVSNAGQSIELVRSARIVGVSVLFLILAVVNQGLWLSWAILVPDIGTMIVATVNAIVTVFNLTWWSLRVLGLRPLLLPAPQSATTPAHRSRATARQHRGAEVQPRITRGAVKYGSDDLTDTTSRCGLNRHRL